MAFVSEALLRALEVARLFGAEGTEVYRLIERGELNAWEGADGLVYVSDQALQRSSGSKS
jgi:hypothetical protein